MENDIIYMKQALAEANEAYKQGEIPIGAVVVCRDKIIAKSHNLTVAVGLPKPFNLDFATCTPRIAFHSCIRVYQACYTWTKLFLNLLDGDIGVFHGVVEDGGGKHFRVVGDIGYDSGSLHRVYYIGKSFAASFGTLVSLYGKLCSLIE